VHADPVAVEQFETGEVVAAGAAEVERVQRIAP
jgi:hypothetical protein